VSAGDYLPGSHLAVVEVHGVALLPAATSAAVLAAVRVALGPGEPDGERAAVLLETLTLGTRMSALPPFAVAVLAPGRVDLLVRGAYRVRVAGPQPMQVDGLHVTSWREESAKDPTLVELIGEDLPAADAEGPGRALTLDRGVALAGSVRIVLTPAGLDAVRTERAEEEISSVADPVDGPRVAPAEVQAEAPLVGPAELAPVGGRPTAVPVQVEDASTVAPEATLAMELTKTGETGTVDGLVTGVPRSITAAGPEAEGAGETDYGFLWEHTVAQGVEQAAVRATGSEELPAAGSKAAAGDHDGATIHLSDLLGPAAAPEPAATGGGGVLSRYCTQGHPNAPHAVACRICGGPTVGDPHVGPRPPLGRVRLSSGETVDLDRSVILGRRPQASRVGIGEIPHLVAVGGKEVSRSHLELRVEDWNVLAVELGSRNGTLLLRPGQPPVRLMENDPMPVRSGDRFDLGEGIVVTAEEVP
jgi:hypothetical protein